MCGVFLLMIHDSMNTWSPSSCLGLFVLYEIISDLTNIRIKFILIRYVHTIKPGQYQIFSVYLNGIGTD